jgi:hypothetical protein
MDYIFAGLCEGDRGAVVAIFNHFVENSFAAFPAASRGATRGPHRWRNPALYPRESERRSSSEGYREYPVAFHFILSSPSGSRS